MQRLASLRAGEGRDTKRSVGGVSEQDCLGRSCCLYCLLLLLLFCL